MTDLSKLGYLNHNLQRNFNPRIRDDWIKEIASTIPENSMIIDISSGNRPYKHLFEHCNYFSHEFEGNDEILDEFRGEKEKTTKHDYYGDINNLPIALFFAMIAGFGMMSQTTVSNTIIQTSVSKEMRGRVISYYAMAFFGMQPIGGLLIGTVSHYAGAPYTILAEGIAAICIAFIFLPFLRKDILKEKDKIELIELEDSSVIIE